MIPSSFIHSFRSSSFKKGLVSKNNHLSSSLKIKRNNKKITYYNFNKQQSRSIALYRAVSKPWRKHELSPNIEEASKFHEIISNHLEKGEYHDAISAFHLCRGRGVIPRLETYRKMMILFYQQGKPHDLFSAIAELNSNGIVVDTYSLLLLLDLYSKNGLILKTEEVFNNIYVGTDGHVGEYALRSLMNCYVLREKWPYVIQLIHAFREYGYEIDKEILELAEKNTIKAARQNYNVLTEEQRKLLDEGSSKDYFDAVVESAKSSWLSRKNLLDEAVRVSYFKQNHPKLYRGKRGNSYEDEQEVYEERKL